MHHAARAAADTVQCPSYRDPDFGTDRVARACESRTLTRRTESDTDGGVDANACADTHSHTHSHINSASNAVAFSDA